MAKRVVRVKALTKKYKNATFFSAPHQDGRTGKFYTGVGRMPEELRKSEFVVKPSDRIPINHNMELNITEDENHRCRYYYFLDLDEVANTLKEAMPGKHLFYIEDLESEAQIQISSDEKMMQAFELIANNQSRDKLNNIMYFMGRDPRGMSDNIVKKVIYSACKDSPQKIIDAFAKTAPYKTFVSQLFFNEIISRRNGIYYFNDIVLGTGMEEAILFVMNPKNQNIIDDLGVLLKSKGDIKSKVSENLKVNITFPDGEVKGVTEEEVDSLLTQYGLSHPPTYKLNGKSKILQKHFNLISEKS